MHINMHQCIEFNSTKRKVKKHEVFLFGRLSKHMHTNAVIDTRARFISEYCKPLIAVVDFLYLVTKGFV